MIGLDFGFGPLEAEFWRFLFVMTRIGAALVAAPLFGNTGVPPQVRVIMSGAIAVFVCGWTPVAAPPALLSLSGMLALAGETTIGLALGFVLQVAFAAPLIAAELIGAGMGMSIASAADPLSGSHSAVLGQYFGVVLTIVFLGIGGHIDWISLVVESYRVFPPGSAWMTPARLQLIDTFAADMFLTALAMALPVLLLLLVVQIVTGVIGRSAPALNLFSLGLPAGVLAGITALIISAPLISDNLTDIARGALTNASALLAR
ncbi:flagellar biosynthetic protein FliR [Novosphingobium nitrogenifigens DSM 19370]|uniref:Flagellar biosynthetic protein FliR n=1 Tax=Novosphingobium nitrogenifigens DSM 19370 TaxID=983920 RepID=F1Z7P9_9SPHN|nr:flagellar biosynthetic protein FliR [Novosphingobium nitrogenifigens]EGD59371.1 flagellar biosynthetic protein FliR [Novosphingobium nitrogenifigens DSM 19370]